MIKRLYTDEKVFLLFILVILSSMLIFNSCSKKEEMMSSQTALTTNLDDADLMTKSSKSLWPRIKFVKRHHGVPPGNGCTAPRGICIIISFKKLNHYPLTKGQINAGWGTASLELDNDKLKVIFDQFTDIGDGSIPIEDDFSVGKYVSDNFGYNDIIVRKGNYMVDYKNEKYPFGYTYFDIEIIK